MSARRRIQRAFSLLELMVSLAIGSVVLLLAAAMLGHSGDGYRRIGGNVASEREARAALTQLAEDLSAAIPRRGNFREKSAAPWPVDRLGFLALQPAAAQSADGWIGDVCAVTYSVADLRIGGKTVRCLMRGVRESDETFRTLRSGGELGDLFAPQPGRDEPIAFGVISFTAAPRAQPADGQWVVDVKLVVVRQELAARLVSAADWDGGNRQLGSFSRAAANKDLETFALTLPFGNHAPR